MRSNSHEPTRLQCIAQSARLVLEVKELSRHHHPSMTLDIVRAYHFGSKYLVELEVENLDEVERAFVHVDYQSRDYDEHVVSREEDALLMYAGYSSEQHKPTMENCGEISPEYAAAFTPQTGSFEEFND